MNPTGIGTPSLPRYCIAVGRSSERNRNFATCFCIWLRRRRDRRRARRVAPDELVIYCLYALTAASTLPSKAAVHRLVAITLAGLRTGG